MFDLVSIGGISIDLFFSGDSLTFKDNRFQLAVGGKYMADYLYEGVGGGGANVAIGASKLGLKSAVLGAIGDNPFKEAILKELTEARVSSNLCHFEKDYLNISSILLTPSGDHSIIHFVPPHENIIHSEMDLNKFIGSKVVYMGNLPDVSLEERLKILHFLKRNNILTVVNLGVKDCRRPFHELEKFIEGIDILIMNTHEFAEAIKKTYEEIDFLQNIASRYNFLRETIVIVTDGEKGSYGYHDENLYFQKAIEPAVIKDSTGCGDGYTAGFIAEFIKADNVKLAMQNGALYASHILEKIGAN